jgi:predicted metal-dependent phosphoesterase TrpH
VPLVDLHLHSTHSDGIFTVAERVRQAKRRGVALLALTDHDTVRGIPEFLRLARTANLQAIPGVEISTEFRGKGLHILGYGIRHRDPALASFLRAQSEDRIDRAREAVRLLSTHGFRISFAAVRAEAGGNIGKPHIAKVILASPQNRRLLRERFGFTGGWSALIDRFFDRAGQLGYIPRKKVDTVRVIQLVRRVGGLPVLAHPMHPMHDYKSEAELVASLRVLSRAGLAGIEAITPWTDARAKKRLLQLSDRFGLIATAGTDNHEDRHLGIKVPGNIYKELIKTLAVL